MRSKLSRWLIPAGLAVATLLGTVETASAQPDHRDHRDHRHRHPRRDYDGPRDAPPPIRAERRERARPGFVWISGSWDWRGGRWEWVSGHWERQRARKRWRETRWEQRDGAWIRVGGDWIDDGPAVVIRPTVAPPPPRDERFDTRPGQVWVRGHWDWQNGLYVWIAGRYEPVRTGRRWRDVRWEQRGTEWVRVDGDWEEVPLYPTAAPPPPRQEQIGARPGFTWVRGRWDWRNGNWDWVPGHWERVRARQQWVEGRWEQRGTRWEWVDGAWQAYPEFPTAAPPPPQPENPGRRPGYEWMPGSYRWVEGRYVWAPGRWEPARPGYRLVPGSWGLRGDRYVWNSETWVASGFVPTPAPAPQPAPQPAPAPVYDGPTQAPPPPRTESYGPPRAGFIWVRGHWKWQNGRYEWVAGHWDRQRARQTWYDAKWELRGNVWVYTPGGWR